MNLALRNSTSGDNERPLKFGKIALYISAAFVIVICLSCDFSALFQNSDYISCLYTGGKLFAQGRAAEIYAPLDAKNFYHAPCDIAAHQFLPHLSANHISLFNYCPLVAFLLAPLSYLPPGYSLLGWQATSLCALAIAIKLLVKDRRPDLIFCASLLFFPTAVTLWIGQTDLVFGVLIFSIGYKLLISRRPFYAGLAFAFCWLKPQMLILPALLSLVLLFKKEWRFVFGFAAGIAFMIALNIAVGGTDLFLQWLWNAHLCEAVFTDPNSAKINLVRYLIISLPGVLFLTLFKNSVLLLKPIIYCFDIILIIFTAITCLRFSKTHSDEYSYISFTVILGLLLMALVVPNYLYYDATTLLVAGCICSDKEFQRRVHLPSYIFAEILAVILFNAYAVLFLINKNLANPVLPLIASILTYLLIAKSAWLKYRDVRATNESN